MKKEINITQYQEGILDICDFLVVELTEFLKDEGRYKYRMLDYIKSIRDEFNKTNKKVTEKDINIYGRVLYVLNRSITRDYQRLRMKRLSPADSVLCIMLKLINVSESLEGGENRFTKEQSRIKEVIQKLYDNIRNKAKYDHLWKIENSIRDSVKINKWGTLSLDEFDLYHVEHPEENPKTQDVIGEKNTWGSSSGKEVNF
jgi:hypothetical protein